MRSITLLLALLFGITAFCQTIKTVRKVVPVLGPEHSYLNGGNKSLMGGSSRVSIPFTLPANTVEWYYSFSTAPNAKVDNVKGQIKLASQLTRLFDPTGLSAMATQQILSPSGAIICAVYLMREKGSTEFMERSFNWAYEVPSHLEEGSRARLKQGVIHVKKYLSGKYYLGFKNLSAPTGTNIIVEIAAIVEEQQIVEIPPEQEKAELYGSMGWKAYERGEYEKCIEHSDKSIQQMPLGWVWANKGLALLQLGRDGEALDAYVNAIPLIKKQDSPALYFDGVISDIDTALKDKPDLSGASDIRELLLEAAVN